MSTLGNPDARPARGCLHGTSAATIGFDAGLSAADVAVGRYGTCVVDDDGALWCSGAVRGWLGAEGPGRIAGIDHAVAVAVGDLHACTLHDDQRITCFGRWDAGEALGPRARVVDEGSDSGRGAGAVSLQQPIQIASWPRCTPSRTPPARSRTRGAVGNGFVCALRSDGMVQCQGSNAMGQLGGQHPEDAQRLEPTKVLLGGVAI